MLGRHTAGVVQGWVVPDPQPIHVRRQLRGLHVASCTVKTCTAFTPVCPHALSNKTLTCVEVGPLGCADRAKKPTLQNQEPNAHRLATFLCSNHLF